MRRTLLLLSTMVLALLLAGGVAQAIINGQPDTGPKAHPYAGALVTLYHSGEFKGQRIPYCSGTLISPRVFLTAGHCTDVLIKEDLPTYVSFDPTYKSGASTLIKATPYTHPKYCIPSATVSVAECAPPGRPDLPRNYRYDVGVAVLERPVRMATYGALPKAGLDDTLKEGQRLTAVGYGANGYDRGGNGPLPQPVYPFARYRATVKLLNTKEGPGFGEMFVKTTGVSFIKGKGETPCFGDSGGPLFLPDQKTIVGVTSLGTPYVCRGPNYYQRMDLPRVLKWVRSFP